MKRFIRQWPVWIGFVLLIILFMAPALAPGKVMLPLDIVTRVWPPWQEPNQAADVHNPLITDVVDYIFPVKAFVAEQVKQGTLPLWNPYVLGGYPLTYNTQAALFYPLSVFYYLLPPATAVDLLIFVQLLLGAAFMFAYLRQIGLRHIAAWVGAVIFLFNGMMIVWLEWQVVHAAVLWLPLQLLFVERITEKMEGVSPPHKGIAGAFWITAPDAVWGGIAFALPWLGGHWNWALYGSLTVVLYTLWRWLPVAWSAYQRRDWVLMRSVIGTAVLLFGIGLGLSLIQVLPAFNYLRQGHRKPFTFTQSLSLGLKEWAVVALIPDFFGNPIHQNWWGRTNYNEITFYAGLLPLFLTVLALILRRDRVTSFFAAWGGLGLLWALGTPAYGLLFVLPVFDGLWPSRAMTVLLLCLAVLSAIGLDALLQEGVSWSLVRRTTSGVGVCLGSIVIGFILWYHPNLTALRGDLAWFGLSLGVSMVLLWMGPARLRPTVFAVLVAGWIALELFWLGHDYNTIGDVADLYPTTETAVFLHNDPEPFRITSLPEGVAYPPNTALMDQLPNISGYEPAILQSMVNYISAAEGSDAIYFERELMPLHGLDSPLIDALNVKYVVTISDWYQETATLGAAQEEITQWTALSLETAVTQPFHVPDAGLHRIDLPLQTTMSADSAVTVRILSADGQQELAHANWDTTQPRSDDSWVSFYFEAFPSEWGREFLLSVIGSPHVQVGENEAGLAFRSYYLPRPQLVHETGKTRIYLNEGYFPRAYVVPQALLAANETAALSVVQEQAAQLDKVIVLETDEPPPQLKTAVSPTSPATIMHDDVNHVVITVDLNDAGFVVLADTYYPGWRATIDGQPTPVYRANGLVRAVYVPAGQHHIVFSFLPLDFVVGTAVTLITLLAAIMVLAWVYRQKKVRA